MAELPHDAMVVEQDPLAFVSYPYEWSFDMLREAAILHLELMRLCIQSGYTLKDATPFNIQFLGHRPVFIDLGSFSNYQDGQPWTAFAQFCRMFLNPLLLMSYTRTPFQTWLRSSLEGLSPTDLSPLLPLRQKLRPAVFTYVVLQTFLQKHFAADSSTSLGIPAQVDRKQIIRQIEKMHRTITQLKAPSLRSAWADYEESSTYSQQAHQLKRAFVERELATDRPQLVWDLGCNRGEYSFVASRYAKTVIALDNDPEIVNLLYHQLGDQARNILPLVLDVLNPSPNQGWRERERMGLHDRGPADAALCLALLHHLRISGSVPLSAIVDWLASIARQAIVEFVPKTDPMVQRLLAWREDIYNDYELDSFESFLRRHFRIRDICHLPTGRILYSVVRP